MIAIWPGNLASVACLQQGLLWLHLLVLLWTEGGTAMSDLQMRGLRQEAEQMFYHGYDNYMKHAFPEDELRPISCTPLTRDRANPGHIELNDALGNYSLTLIDSLSTLAIMTSSSVESKGKKKNHALSAFQDGVKALVDQYGDGSDGNGAIGKRARGFDLDSKVQVFETVIRGVAGLVSAHLFAVGELPMGDYKPKTLKKKKKRKTKEMPLGAIKWPNKFIYDGQLLRLAENLARRLLPAFVTTTGLPYPRVNLRYGVPFYSNSPLNANAETGECPRTPSPSAEITETCSAGAGSLVLEFTTLSRLTGDLVFEQVAKRAFWAVWDRKSAIGLVGSGIDAESGHWTTPYTGIGAGIDSFYEYAAKASVLLSGSPIPGGLPPIPADGTSPGEWTRLVSEFRQTAGAFGEVWLAAHDSIKRHLYRNSQYTHPHYIQGDLFTGAGRAYWIDSLSAFYPGVLATTGELEEAIETHLLATAIWTRYSALPERWSVSSGGIEAGLGWWGGRPEFIESTYHLYQATKDPWYLHVGEMVLRDIKRRCWTKCGWAGIQNVKNGDQSDRMESFFLGETTKYLFLLFSPEHPLNKLDAPFVFSTEGHPLIIPRSAREPRSQPSSRSSDLSQDRPSDPTSKLCDVPPTILPFSISATAARGDLFHAAKLARLHMMPTRETLESPLIEYSNDHPSITVSDIRSPSNFTFYPWTLPSQYIPNNGMSSKIHTRHTFDITFPTVPNTILGPGILQRVGSGILVNSLSGIRFGLIQDVPPTFDTDTNDMEHYRVQSVNNILLGRDERVFLAKNTAEAVIPPSDPNFTRVRDASILDIVIDIPPDPNMVPNITTTEPASTKVGTTTPPSNPNIVIQAPTGEPASSVKQAFSMLLQQVGLLLTEPTNPPPARPDTRNPLREYIPATLPTGPGAAPVPDMQEALPPDIHGKPQGDLLWSTAYIAPGYSCTKLPDAAPRDHQIIVMRRGKCSFATKLQNIPTFAPSRRSLQLVIVVSFGDDIGGVGDQSIDGSPGVLIRPLLDAPQLTRSGLPRRNPIPMVMVEGGEAMWQLMQKAVKVGLKRRYEMRAQGVPIANLNVL